MAIPYPSFGAFIDAFNPYSDVSAVADPAGESTGILIAASGPKAAADPRYHTVRDAPPLYWPFRLPHERQEWLPWRRPFEPGPVTWPGGGAGYRNKIWEVENCRIVKAIVVPYEYDRILARRSPAEVRKTMKMKAHILIGYTAPFDVPDNPSQPIGTLVDPDQYERLGAFIEAEHPVEKGELDGPPQNTEIIVDLDNRVPPTFMNAVCWLGEKSRESLVLGLDPYPLGSSADDEMQTLDKQQCLTWIFPQRYRNAAGQYQDDQEGGPPAWWMRGYQVTKAFRVQYKVVGSDANGEPPLIGDILVGYSGSGDA